MWIDGIVNSNGREPLSEVGSGQAVLRVQLATCIQLVSCVQLLTSYKCIISYVLQLATC